MKVALVLLMALPLVCAQADYKLVKNGKYCTGTQDFNGTASSAGECATSVRDTDSSINHMAFKNGLCRGYQTCNPSVNDGNWDLYALNEADSTLVQSGRNCAGTAVEMSNNLPRDACADFCSQHSHFAFKENSKGCYCYDDCQLENANGNWKVYSVEPLGATDAPSFAATNAPTFEPSSATDYVLLKTITKCKGFRTHHTSADSPEDCATKMRAYDSSINYMVSNHIFGGRQCLGWKTCDYEDDPANQYDLYSLTQSDFTEVQKSAACNAQAKAKIFGIERPRCADFCSSYPYFSFSEFTGALGNKCYCYLNCDVFNFGQSNWDIFSVDPKGAKPKNTTGTTAWTSGTRPTVFAERVTEVIDYWTPERRSQAVPLDMRTITDPFHPKGRNAPGRYLYGTGENQTFYDAENSISNGHWKGIDQESFSGTMSEAAGRIFFIFGTTFASCSGTAVRDYSSSDRSLIVTAAHCIYEERKKIFATHILFVPSQDDGGQDVGNLNCHDDRFGCWVADFGVVDSVWAESLNDVAHDFGFYVVPNQGSHSGEGGLNLVLEDTVKTVDMDWNNKAALEVDRDVYTMGLPGRWSTELRYAKGPLKMKQNLQFVYGCTLTEGSSGGPMPIDPYADKPELFSVSSFKSGYFEDGEFIQTACGGPILHGNSYCGLLVAAEEANLVEAGNEGGIILPYRNKGCKLPGSCLQDDDCDDGVFCNGIESCVDGFCASGSDPCFGGGCEEDFGCLPPCTSDAECDDGVFCNGVETCSINGTCVSGPGNPCGEGEMCDSMIDTCTQAECINNAECSDGWFCNGEELCVDGQCYFGEPPCEAHEKCDEVTQSCPLTVCWLIDEADYCVLDDECCVCLYECEPQQTSMAECAPHLFFPERPEPAFTWIELDEEEQFGNTTGYFGNTTWPTCLWSWLFVDGDFEEKFKEIH